MCSLFFHDQYIVSHQKIKSSPMFPLDNILIPLYNYPVLIQGKIGFWTLK
jgi:hypothetical protein